MKTKGVLVLGGGMIGSAMAMDLSRSGGLEVTVADARPEALERVASRYGVRTVLANLGRPDVVGSLVAGYDLVVGALPSTIGYQTLRAVVEAGRNCVDISFMTEDALALDGLARANGVTAVVDCGVAPGVSNMMVGHAAAQLDAVARVEIYVGGLPVQRRWPYDYKAGFAPYDVVEEYVRPARVVEGGRVVVKEALTESEMVDVPGVGTLEAFLTDGLRSLASTIDAPFMKEKTLRYPGHLQLMRVLRETGFFSKEPVDVRGQQVRPLDVTAAILFPRWTFEEGEPDLTVLRVVVEGTRAGRAVTHTWNLLDSYDPETGLRSMSRTTAFPATVVARILARGEFPRPGVHPPETLGRAGLLDEVLRELLARGIKTHAEVEEGIAA
jgi:saccharopine dehydrogenase-like NADP-dependent oxidoreductase